MGTEQCWACTESPPLEAGGTRLGLRPRLHYLWSCAIVLDLSSLLCAAGTVVPASGALGGLWVKCPEGCAVIQNMAGGQWQCRGKGWAGLGGGAHHLHAVLLHAPAGFEVRANALAGPLLELGELPAAGLNDGLDLLLGLLGDGHHAV